MIAKLITHGKDRTEAMDRMIRAIDDYKITGVQTTLPFCKFAIQHEAFRSGKFDTHFVKKYFSPEMLLTTDDIEMELAALLSVEAMKKTPALNKSGTSNVQSSRWKSVRTKYNI
jgi:acetyl/propionyl-CoA carboxylase alpha subunit